MKTAVLCPGASLAQFSGRGEYERVLGVNRAPHIVADRILGDAGKVDWWVFADAHVFTTYPLSYAPAVLTTKDSWAKLAQQAAGHAVRGFEMLAAEWPLSFGWQQFSGIAAMLLASRLGAKSIDLFGVDLSGTADADGHEYNFPHANAQGTRTPRRWNDERVLWEKFIGMLKDKSVEVACKSGAVGRG